MKNILNNAGAGEVICFVVQSFVLAQHSGQGKNRPQSEQAAVTACSLAIILNQ